MILSNFNKSAIRISLFSSLSYAVDYSFQLVDIYWVAKLGPGAPTAIAIVSAVFFLILSLNEIVGASTVSVFSRTFGTGDFGRTGTVIVQAIGTKIVLGLLLVAIFAMFLKFGVPIYTKDPDIQQYVFDYGNIIWLSLVIVPAYSTIMTALRVVGEESKTSWVSICAVIVNIALNPILIFGWGGFEGLGVAGAAWATVIAQVLAIMMGGAFLLRNRLRIPFSLKGLSWEGRLYRDYLLIGLPLAGVMILYNLEQAIVTGILSRQPSEISDGFSIGARIYGLLFMANFGIKVASSITVGKFIGMGKTKEIEKRVPQFAGLVALSMAIICLCIFAFSTDIISLFSDNPSTVETGAVYLNYMLITTVLFSLIYTVSGAFGGAGRNLPILKMYAIMYLAIEFPLILIVAPMISPDLEWIWIAIVFSSAIGAMGMFYQFNKKYWQTNSNQK